MSPHPIEPPALARIGSFPGPRKHARLAGFAAGLIVVVLAATAWIWSRSVPGVSGRLPQQAYLWQRQWTDSVCAAVAEPGPISGLCVSYAEISGGANSAPVVNRTTGIDWALLAGSARPVGFGVRVHEFPGEVNTTREPFPTLRAEIAELCHASCAAGLRPAEIQVDFDCPTSRLKGFAAWLQALRQAFPQQTFRFTALPAWLRSNDFAPLAEAAGGYILQLHWFPKPDAEGHPPATLCDPAQAKAAVERAARLGVPFRVALPTYGYRLILDDRSKLLAAAAEESSLRLAQPAPGGSSRTLMADPAAMADLIAGWQRRRPSALQGVIWYRLPVAGDRLNWQPRTLWAVMAGRHPQPKLTLKFARESINGPWELRLGNEGEADAALPAEVTVHCASAPMAADGVGGFELEQNGGALKELMFAPRHTQAASARTLPAGRSIAIGWVRLADRIPAEPMEALLTASLRSNP